MKTKKNRILSGILACSLALLMTGCGDKKETQQKNTPAESTQKEVTAPVAQADQRFKKILSHVPADTAYLFTNKKAIPHDVLESNLQRYQQMMEVWIGLLEENTLAAETDSDKASKEEAEQANDDTATAEKSPENSKADAFLTALLHELTDNLSIDKIHTLGLDVDGHSALYSVGIAPVFRAEISNKKALMETLKRAEQKSGYTVQWKKCGDYDCIDQSDEEGGKNGFALLMLDDQIAAGLYTNDNKQQLMSHLQGKSIPETAYAANDWNAFLDANGFPGYGDGFVKLKQFYGSAESNIRELEKAIAKSDGKPFDEKQFNACSTLISRHLEHIPEVFFGIKALQAKTAEYEIVLKTSPTVTDAVSKIPNALSGLQQSANPIFDLGLNINIDKLREALTQYSGFLVNNAQTLQCDAVNAADVRKAMGSFSMATMMGINRFKAIYVSLNDLKLSAEDASRDTTGTPPKIEKLDLYASIQTENPTVLLQMLGMVNPSFATIKLPKDGTPTKLPEGLLPPNPSGFTPEIYLSQKDQALNILVGNMKPALKTLTTDHPVFYWSTVDSKRYNNILATVTRSGMSGKAPAQEAEAKKAMEVLTRINELTGQVQTLIGTDKRGIVIDYSVRL